MGKTLTLALASLFLLAASAGADTGIATSLATPGIVPGDGAPLSLKEMPKGLFDASRLSFQHTVGISFGSGSYGGVSQYYLNTITYKVSKPLTIQARVGIQNNLYGTPSYGLSKGGGPQLVVPYVGVLYQPRSNIRIEFQFSNLPGYGYDRFGWGGYPY